jgi:Tol biopolymer transport system component
MAVIAWTAWFRSAWKSAGRPMHILPFTTFPGHQGDAHFSPDGNRVAFSWDGDKEHNGDIYLNGTARTKRIVDIRASDQLASNAGAPKN